MTREYTDAAKQALAEAGNYKAVIVEPSRGVMDERAEAVANERERCIRVIRAWMGATTETAVYIDGLVKAISRRS